MCSITLGPAIWPSLVTWPTSSSAEPCALAKRTSDCVAARTWLTVPGAASSPSAQSVWIEFDHDEVGRFPVRQRGQDVGEARLAGEAQRHLSQAQPLGPQAHLRGGFLAREVDRAPSRGGEGRRHLQQQRRLADAGLAADQQGGARHDAAARDPVELGKTCRHALDPVGPPPRPAICSPTARPLEDLARPDPGGGAASASSTMVFHSPQSGALAGPARGDGAAVLAHERGFWRLWP